MYMMYKNDPVTLLVQSTHATGWLQRQLQLLKDQGYKEIAPGVWENAQTQTIVEF